MIQELFPVLDGMPMGDLWVLLAWGLLFMVVWMFLLWLCHFKLQNAGTVDFGWASGLALLAIFYALNADGYGPRRLLIGTMAGVWGGRLAWHILKDRILGGKAEDPRYTDIRARWETRLGLKFFFFFQFQAVLAVFLSVPFALLAVDSLDRITLFEWTALLIWIVAILGESTADAQLKHFRSDPENKGHVCQEGLWNYSRHPNYFFEWLIWVAYFVAALSTDYGIWTIACPLLMLYFLLRVSGIPATEEHALQSRGEEYAEYQRTTSMFIPWVKRHVE